MAVHQSWSVDQTARDNAFPIYWLKPLSLLAVFLTCFLVSFRGTLAEMVHTWLASKTYSHCFLVPAMFGWLISVRRRQLSATKPSSNYWALLCTGVLAGGWLLGYLGEAREVQQVMLLGIFASAVWALLGTSVLQTLRFPLAFLVFTIPFGVSLVPWLQDSTAWFAFHALNLSRIPAVLDHRTISLPSGNWTIAETCSGIRYLFASVVLGIFYASLVYRSWKRRLIFVGLSILVPIAANAVRAYGIVLVGYLSGNRLAVGVDHIIYGAVFFIAMQAALLAAGLHWREAQELPNRPRLETSTRTTPPLGIRTPVAALVIMLVIGAPLLGRYLWNRSAANFLPDNLSVSVGPCWQRLSTYDSSWDPPFRDPDRQSGQEYECGEDHVHLYWALYAGQGGTELAGSALGYGDPGYWTLASEKIRAESLGGRLIPVDKRVLQAGLNTRSQWTLYWVAGEYAANPARVKFLQAKARLMGKSAAVVIVVVGSEDALTVPNSAEQSLQNFLAHASLSISTPS